MNDVDGQASLTPIVWTRSDGLGELQAHLGSERQDAETWYSMGLALLEEGRQEEAATAFHAALTLHPHSLAIEAAYATALGSLGATHEAAHLLEDVIHRNPGDGWAYFHLAALRYRQGDCELAAQLWETAARLVENPTDSLENLALVRRRLGQVEDERRCWQRAAKHDPTNPMALHMLAAVGLTPTPTRADGAYITCMFDRFAPDFDRVLAQLQYHVPDLCAEWMHDQFGPPRRHLRVLDAGCGTGLCGARLRPWAAELVGVDLSARMLEQAARRGVYERLERADLIEFLRANRGGFDVVVAGDVLCYFGDLGPFAQGALASLRAEGLLGFSVERAGDDELGDRKESGYLLRHHGRYAHTSRHIKHAFGGGTIRLAEIAVRLELGEAVGGYWVSAQRKGHARTIERRAPAANRR